MVEHLGRDALPISSLPNCEKKFWTQSTKPKRYYYYRLGKKKHELGLLKGCYNKNNLEQHFRSLAFVNKNKKEQYITRTGRGKNAGGRGIDHIIANRHTECTLAEIDQHAAHLAIFTSDHYSVYADIPLGIKLSKKNLQAITTYKYKNTASIPMEMKKDSSTKTVTIEHTKSLTGEEFDNDPHHKLLQVFCSTFQDNQDIEMRSIKKQFNEKP